MLKNKTAVRQFALEMCSFPRSVALGVSLGALACSHAKPADSPPPAYEVDNSDDENDTSGMGVMAEVGGLNEEKVEKTFKRLQPGFTSCLMAGLKRVEFLGGEVHFLVNVDLQGAAEAAFIERSSLGDYETEQCMLDHIRATRWPKPVGGKIGLARSSVAFDTPPDVRPPVPWSSDDVAEVLSENQGALGSCGGGGPFEITAYVDTSGKVMSAGIAHSDATADATAKCYVEQLRSLRFASPGSWPAKVSFRR